MYGWFGLNHFGVMVSNAYSVRTYWAMMLQLDNKEFKNFARRHKQPASMGGVPTLNVHIRLPAVGDCLHFLS